MDVVDALIEHHGVLRKLADQAEGDATAFEEFRRHLVVHHTMEEKYFYDFLQQIASARKDSLEAVNEHHIIELILKDAEDFPPEHERFAIKVEGLGEYTAHHLDEEEADIFPMARQLFAASDLSALGGLFLEAKDTLLNVGLPQAPSGIDTTGSGAAKSLARGLGIGSLKKMTRR
ncbi:MAG: hemerythrin domain-containing protein [Deltaproteobacteria bacterium]|jgi:hemerythrin-like domain-containing protein|nr:hemerythrin domain-containing protein [Deltaproteobacteria bacterium]